MAALVATCEGLTWPQRFVAIGAGFFGAVLWNAGKSLVRRARA